MAIIAVCLIVLLKGFGAVGWMQYQQEEQEQMLSEVTYLLHELEHQPPIETTGVLIEGWTYHTHCNEEHYILTLSHRDKNIQYQFLIREVPV